MIRIRQTLLSAVSLIKHFGFAVRAFVQGKLASTRDRRLLSRMSQRQLRELGLARNKDIGTYDQIP